MHAKNWAQALYKAAPQAKTTDRNSTASALVKLLGEVAR